MGNNKRNVRTNSKQWNADGKGQSTREEEESSNVVVENKSIPPLETPRILTRNAITSLTHGLDASDVVECYALVRSAPLHGIANSTIKVQKMAIGIRFRPTATDLKNPFNTKTPMELTLEYGPARLGPLLKDEATPIVQGNDDSSAYVSWDNAGKVYYTQKIVANQFLSSYYMASMTGAVLNKLLTESVEYTEKRKVYQPFAVYSSETGQRLMRSSSSSDFSWFVWSHLAKLGVEIEPILQPSLYQARLYAKSVVPVFADAGVTKQAADFYKKLYRCLESIATNNFGSYLSSRANNQHAADTLSEDEPPSNGNGNDRHRLKEDIDDDNWDEDNDDATDSIDDDDEEEDGHDEFNGEKEKGARIEDDDQPNDDETAGKAESHEMASNSLVDKSEPSVTKSGNVTSTKEGSQNETKKAKSSSQSDASKEDLVESSLDGSWLPTEAPSEAGTHDSTADPTEGIQDVEKAQNAANDAQKAADEAKIAAQTEGETKAATAAQAAADAALAAADATASAASQAAKDSLLSGDGTLMSSIIGTCFSNPNYEIAADTNGTNVSPSTTEIFLFRDPSNYYKLELSSPYLEVVKLNHALPKTPGMLQGYGSGGDALDWTLAMMILSLLFMMVLLICQQMGNHYIEVVFRCQRWFFNPRKHDDEDEPLSGVQSGSHFFFGQSGIPVSMGGRRSIYAPVRNGSGVSGANVSEYRDEPELENNFRDEETDLSENIHGDGMGIKRRPLSPRMTTKKTPELEMTTFSSTHKKVRSRSGSMDSSNGSLGDANVSLEIPKRLLRNPDLVELPSLKSRSKVAVPVGGSTATGSNRSNQNGGSYTASSSFTD